VQAIDEEGQEFLDILLLEAFEEVRCETRELPVQLLRVVRLLLRLPD